MKKICIRCKKSKTQYHRDKHNSDGFRNICKDCAKEQSKKYYRESEDYRNRIRSSGLKLRLGITNEDYFELLKEQNNQCAICNTKAEENKYFHVDHDHVTGKIRGLLCKQCNHGLGNFRDTKQLLRNAIKYLDRNFASKS